MNTSGNDGFTLPELMIVMVIISLLGMGAVQGWQGWQQHWQQHWQLQDSAIQLRQFLLALRATAGWYNSPQIVGARTGKHWCVHSQKNVTVPGERQLCAPWPEVSLLAATAGTGFYGLRDVARPGSFVLQNAAGISQVIVSSRGRIRICPAGNKTCAP